MPTDLTGLEYFAPIIVFFLVFVILYAVLFKTKLLGEGKFLLAVTSFLVASLFVSFAGLQEYVINIVPWFAVLLISVFLIFALMGFVGKDIDFLKTGIGVAFVVVLLIVFLVSGYVVFSTQVTGFWEDISAYPRFLGAALLLIIGALISWVLVRGK